MKNDLNNWIIDIKNYQIMPLLEDECIDYISKATELFNLPDKHKLKPAKIFDKTVLKICSEINLILIDTKIPDDIIKTFIDSCYNLFEKDYSELKEYNESCFMFWDALIGRVLTENKDKQKLFFVLAFQCLTEILKLNNQYCRMSALHGLYHLNDERGKQLICNFISECNNTELLNYAKKLLSGKEL